MPKIKEHQNPRATQRRTRYFTSRAGVNAKVPPPLAEGQVRCPSCRNAARTTGYGCLRTHRDLFGDKCYNRAQG